MNFVEELFEENENLELEKILEEKEKFQNKCQEFERLNFELQEQLRLEKEKLKQQNQEFEQKMAKEKEEFQNKFQDYAILNLELQKELRAEKSEKEKLKQKIVMLQHNTENVIELVYEDQVKQEYLKTELKSETGD